jgi:hypothetical protein
MRFLIRYLCRCRLLREARALEAEARRLRHALPDRLAATWGAPRTLSAIAVLCATQWEDTRLREVAKAVLGAAWGTAGDEDRAADLERRARQLREKARRV